MVKLVVFSDLHLDSAFAWAGVNGDGARRRRQGLRDTLVNITRLAVREEADAILCGGDLFERDRLTPDTAEFLRSTFEKVSPMKVVISPGNHDWWSLTSPYKYIQWSDNVHIFQMPMMQSFILSKDLTIWGAAYSSPAKGDGFIDTFVIPKLSLNVGLFHGSERGWFHEQGVGKADHAPFDEARIPLTNLNHLFVGHYHQPKDAQWFTYPGNPDPLAFGETGERGAVVATIADDGTITRERHHVGVSKAHDLTLDISEASNQQGVRDRLVGLLEGLDGVARVTLTGELQSRVDLRTSDLTRSAPWLDGLVVRVGDIRQGYDYETLSQEPTVRGQFVRDVLDGRYEPEERRRVLVTGLRALEGRDDLEVL